MSTTPTNSEADAGSKTPGLINVPGDSHAKETPLSDLDTWTTPTERFYVRSHFPELPTLALATYRLEITGAVDRPFTIGYDELLTMPSVEIVVTMECAGNSRSYVTPPAEGLSFKHGAVGTAKWKGVPLPALLSRAGLRDTTKEVLFEGADIGDEEEEGQTVRLGYARSLPVADATSEETIAAYEMNGEPIRPVHGYPVRLIAPRWYGMASVKWLTRIEALEQPYTGFFQRRRYVLINEGEAPQDSWEPLSTLRVKSLITHPRHGEVVRVGQYTVRGAAWSGDGEVVKVEASVNGGRDWQEVSLVGPSSPTAWRRWEHSWSIGKPGHYILMARATDSVGNTQPASIPWNFRGYGNNGIHTIAVEVSQD